VVGGEPLRFYGEASAVSAGARAIAEAAAALSAAVTGIIAHGHAEARDFYSARQSRELIPILHLIQEVAASLADPPLEPSSYCVEVAALPVADGEVAEVLRLSMRQSLFGHHALVEDRPGPALLRMLFVQLGSLYGARLKAAIEGRARVVAGDLSRSHMLVNRVFNFTKITSVLVEHEPLTWDALEALPRLAGWR
jgi:hypothetical protein